MDVVANRTCFWATVWKSWCVRDSLKAVSIGEKEGFLKSNMPSLPECWVLRVRVDTTNLRDWEAKKSVRLQKAWWVFCTCECKCMPVCRWWEQCVTVGTSRCTVEQFESPQMHRKLLLTSLALICQQGLMDWDESVRLYSAPSLQLVRVVWTGQGVTRRKWCQQGGKILLWLYRADCCGNRREWGDDSHEGNQNRLLLWCSSTQMMVWKVENSVCRCLGSSSKGKGLCWMVSFSDRVCAMTVWDTCAKLPFTVSSCCRVDLTGSPSLLMPMKINCPIITCEESSVLSSCV